MVQVGWDMKARAGKKAVVLELGGNAATILEDFRSEQELDAIVGKLVYGAFYQSGQSCISLQRLFVRQVQPSFCQTLRLLNTRGDLAQTPQHSNMGGTATRHTWFCCCQLRQALI